MTCGPVERSDEDSKAITNPILLVEVLSDSTEAYDRGQKFEYFSKLLSLRESIYYLVSTNQRHNYITRPSAAQPWQITWVNGLDQSLSLQFFRYRNST